MPPRCVLVLDPASPRWLIANAAAVLGASVGAAGGVQLGPDLVDADGAQFVVPGPTVTGQMLLFASTTVVASVLWWAIVILVVAQGRSLVVRTRARRVVDALSGTALLAVPVGVARG